MAIDVDDRMRRYWASNAPGEYPIFTLAIAHSALSQVFRFWNQPGVGWLDVEGVLMEHRPVNFQVEQEGTNANLDQLFKIAVDVVDAQDELREELDRIQLETKERIIVVYRQFLYPVLDTPCAIARLQAESLSYVKGAANISAASPRYNMLRTGEIYSPRDIPMLRAFQ